MVWMRLPGLPRFATRSREPKRRPVPAAERAIVWIHQCMFHFRWCFCLFFRIFSFGFVGKASYYVLLVGIVPSRAWDIGYMGYAKRYQVVPRGSRSCSQCSLLVSSKI